MASYRKRSAGWRAEIARQGVRESATFDTKAEAVAWATKREAEIMDGAGGKLPTRTLAQALERYRTEVSPSKGGARWEVVRLQAFQRRGDDPFFEMIDQPLADIDASDWASWRDKRLQQVSAATVNRELNLIRSVLENARREWLWTKTNSLTDVRRPASTPPRDRRVSEDEIQRMCFALGYVDGQAPSNSTQRIAVAFLLAIETAMRAGELCALTWDRVHLAGRFVTLTKTKNGDKRNVPLSKKAASLIQLLPRNGVQVIGVSTATLDTLWRRARQKALIDNLHFHDSRHEALTRLAKKLSVLDLARMVGHRDPRSLMIYYNATATEIAEQLD
ncbi:site-specific integrase [Jeongeupia naejangsanensis]|uniref:Site-specific integrase n=2 Tax=Jeongeupia naejangsanensis TaxID=613195 RepID=A0ABS2BH98_9NEIS|nr:site-specific integrase [Jeongeupia naejangsanensis]